MSGIIELLSGILRFFPNTMIVTLFVVGITLGKLSWILVAIGGIVVTILTLTIQYMLGKTIGMGLPAGMPGSSVVEACSLLPVVGGTYAAVPSLWISLSSFFATYIFMNALNVYSETPARANRERLAVFQRKGMGLISILAVVVLFVFLLVPRYMTSCETIGGIIGGLIIGIGAGVAWWTILDACGPDVYPDIHGVMIGLKPGSLRTHPIACAPGKK